MKKDYFMNKKNFYSTLCATIMLSSVIKADIDPFYSILGIIGLTVVGGSAIHCALTYSYKKSKKAFKKLEQKCLNLKNNKTDNIVDYVCFINYKRPKFADEDSAQWYNKDSTEWYNAVLSCMKNSNDEKPKDENALNFMQCVDKANSEIN